MIRSEPEAPPPLWPSLTLTWVNNLGAAATLMGIYFVAKHAYGFTAVQSLLLGLLQGVTYVAAALSVGPCSRRLAGPGKPLSTRGLLALIMVVMSGLCIVPSVVDRPWAVWLLVGLYSAASGWLWPIIESFLSGGRTGADLRRATGRFNISWASSQVVTFWLMAPFMDAHPVASITVLGLSHVLCLPVVFRLPREPAAHEDHPDAALSPAERAKAARLLSAHRMLLVLSYVVYSALSPLLPTIMGGLMLPASAETRWASIWMVSRVGMFFLMERWHGWHGRSGTLLWSAAILLTGFGLCMLATSILVLAIGLALFGIGAGSVYAAAFYYAMEVGSAGIDAGGKHEALIGVGYSTGPAAGLGAAGLIALQVIEAGHLQAATLGTVGVIAAAASLGAARSIRRKP